MEFMNYLKTRLLVQDYGSERGSIEEEKDESKIQRAKVDVLNRWHDLNLVL